MIHSCVFDLCPIRAHKRIDSAMEPQDTLHFEIVPSRSRHDGWTPARQRAFVEHLAILGLVGAAARAVGMSAKSAYGLRRRAGEWSSFATAWDRAVELGRARARDLAIERALEGELVPIYHRGRLVGSERRFDNRLIIMALKLAWREENAPRARPRPSARRRSPK